MWVAFRVFSLHLSHSRVRGLSGVPEFKKVPLTVWRKKINRGRETEEKKGDGEGSGEREGKKRKWTISELAAKLSRSGVRAAARFPSPSPSESEHQQSSHHRKIIFFSSPEGRKL